MQRLLLLAWVLLFVTGSALGAPVKDGSAAGSGYTTVTWLGHAAFKIETPKGNVLLVDPWLSNPKAPKPTAPIKRLDYILITHGHFDHIGDAVALATKTGARLVANFELGNNMVKLLGYPEKQLGFDTLMNVGGRITIADGEVAVQMTPAVHSSGMKNPHAGAKQPDTVYGGIAAGFVLDIQNGPTIYHTGDTAFFSDMKLIGRDHRIDLGLINIGGHFGMEVPDAVRAVRVVGAKWVVPHHYGTFPILTEDPQEFCRLVGRPGKRCIVMTPGGTLRFQGRRIVR